MKLSSTLQKKRKTPKPSGFRVLHAVTGNRKKKKQRAATATADDLGGEVPGVGVARALVVIALLHIVAIGGIWMHNDWTKENDLQGKPAPAPKVEPKTSVVLVPGGEHYAVQTGDNYFNVARKHGVDMQDLKKANNFVPLSPNLRINIPQRRQESTTPSEAVAGLQGVPVAEKERPAPPVVPVERPRIQTSDTVVQIPAVPSGGLVEVESAPPSRLEAARVEPKPEDKPLLIKPRVIHETPTSETGERTPARAIVVAEDAQIHTVQRGDTLWALSRKYGTTPDAIMKANGIKDANKVHLGAKLTIPQ
ncbi:MAG: LysM peptidoglycan-binding domain-containing protein [Akkermansiaceae bacterium]